MNKEIQIFDAGQINYSLTSAYLEHHLIQLGLEASVQQQLNSHSPLVLVTMRSPYPSAAHALVALQDAEIPLRSSDRSETDPIVVFGGMAMRNPFFMNEIYDACWIGDSTPQTFQGLQVLSSSYRAPRWEKLAMLKDHGFYVPSLYVPEEKPLFHRNHDYDFSFVVSDHLSVVEFSPDRKSDTYTVQIEVKRGCGNGCSFCVDSHTPSQTMEADQFTSILQEMLDRFPIGNVRVSFPELTDKEFLTFIRIVKESLARTNSDGEINIGSTAPHHYSKEVARELASLGQRTMTFAPEVASGNFDGVDLRKQNKRWLTDRALFSAIDNGVSVDMNRLILYHLTGFPGETDAHIEAYIQMVKKIKSTYPSLELIRVITNPVFATVGTPLERAPQITFSETQRRINLMRRLTDPSIEIRSMLDLKIGTSYDKTHLAEVGYQQAYFQRAPERMNTVLITLSQSLVTPQSYLTVQNAQIEELMDTAGISLPEFFQGQDIVTFDRLRME